MAKNKQNCRKGFEQELGDGVAAVKLERIFKIIQSLTRLLVAAVDNPAICMQQNGRTEIAFRIPPIAGATGGAAGAENAFIEPIELFAVFRALQPF